MSHSPTAPLGQKDRIELIDIIRGVALLGILMMNIPFFSNPVQYHDNPSIINFSGVNYTTWWTVNGLFEGTMRGLFTILFGAGSLLLLTRLESKNNGMAADIYYRRLLWLLLFGMINAYVILWPGDILYSYAICGLFLYPFRNMKAKHLFTIGICLLILTTAKDTWKLYESKAVRVDGEKALALEASKQKLTPEQEEAKTAWAQAKEQNDPKNLKKEASNEIKKIQQGYFGVFSHFRNINFWIQTQLFYRIYFLDIILLLFLGMALFKSGIVTGMRSKKFYWGLMAFGYVTGLTTSYLFLNSHVQNSFDHTRYADATIIELYQVKRILLTLGHLSFLVLLYKYKVVMFLLQWLKRVGQMAFTNYLMQSIIGSLIFYGYGFKMFGKLEIHQQYYVVLGIWAFQILFSNVWLRYFRFGPFEWLWRSLTYWEKQPMKRGNDKIESEQKISSEPAIASIA
jgi:uncharacterized protein